jgi:CheY-like chemotaxis protein
MTDFAIFVVEDDPDHRQLIVAALSGCCDPGRIGTAADGLEALDYLLGRGSYAGRDTRKQPRLVLLDVHLPRLHGLEVLKAVRRDPATQSVPVVMLSSAAEKQELDSCYEAGANSVIGKTADFDELQRKMKTVHDFWLTVNEANRNSRV